ncbi:hypothetical protein KKA02_01095 [Patescibacteria group bacterium]|nr:hypothetical protein [Patescibacteria group bacterium]
MTSKTVVLRDRNQLTIPTSIAKNFDWLTPDSVLRLYALNNTILISPYKEKTTNWDKVWKNFQSVAKKGKKISLTKFLIKDRLNRR